jgi:uncharacterized membrane protein YfcA
VGARVAQRLPARVMRLLVITFGVSVAVRLLVT